MKLNQTAVIDGLVEELLTLIHKYDESLHVSTVLGCLDVVKQQIINDAMEDDSMEDDE